MSDTIYAISSSFVNISVMHNNVYSNRFFACRILESIECASQVQY